MLVLNFYPYLQKYITPSRKDVTQLLAALVQACHDHVPPDALQPVMRQLVDQFVHDRARPEVITVGIKTVREICVRAPLVMNQELLVRYEDSTGWYTTLSLSLSCPHRRIETALVVYDTVIVVSPSED